MIQTFSKETPLADALYDTWTWNQDAGTWSIEYELDQVLNSASDLNLWYAESITRTLKAFENLTRAWRVSFGATHEYQDKIDGVLLEWKMGESYSQYLNEVLHKILEFSAPIHEISIDVDEFLYVRTKQSSQPIQSWIRRPHSEFTISIEMNNIVAGLWFRICHTLYGPGNKEYSPLTGPYPEPDEDFKFDLDNNELQVLNQPLLEEALKQWEEYIGYPISEVEGIPGIYKYGFIVEPY
jgi:hypothetical protein